MRQSFSRIGKPRDSVWSERFFANLKKEAVHWVHFKTRDQARQAMFAYIEDFYNTKRIQKRLGHLSPVQRLHICTQNKQNVWLNFLSEKMLTALQRHHA